MDLSNVILTNKCHVNLDGTDEWAKCCIFSHHCPPVRARHQQGKEGVMLWPAVIDDKTISNKKWCEDRLMGLLCVSKKHFLLWLVW